MYPTLPRKDLSCIKFVNVVRSMIGATLEGSTYIPLLEIMLPNRHIEHTPKTHLWGFNEIRYLWHSSPVWSSVMLYGINSLQKDILG